MGISKNAVVGKARRLDLPGRPSPIRRDVPKKPTPEGDKFQPKGPPRRKTLPKLPVLRGAPTQEPRQMKAVAVVPEESADGDDAEDADGDAPAVAATVGGRHTLARLGMEGAEAGSRMVAEPSERRILPRTSSKTCCWPIGEPGTKGFRFCSDPAIGGKPYCGEHSALAYVRVKDRREDAATA